MIFTLLLSSVIAQQQSLICEQIFDPSYCKGPAASPTGFVCIWAENECETVNPNDPENACKLLSAEPTACAQATGCVFQDLECKKVDYNNQDTALYTPPTTVNQGTQNVPYTPTNQVPQTVQTQAPVQTVVPNSVVPAWGTNTQRPTTQTNTNTGARQFCKVIRDPLRCFGPSTTLGKLCMWDAEDMECSEATEGSVEAICKQFARDPLKCDQHENCFWDDMDRECSEIEFERIGGFTPGRSVIQVQCSASTTETTCAYDSSCFWDGNICMNIMQATNVCVVFNSAQECSASRMCHWRDNTCRLDPNTRGLHLQNAENTMNNEASSDSKSLDYFIMFACGFSGALLGLAFSFGTQKCCQRTPQQDDYHDIVLDVNTSRRQVV